MKLNRRKFITSTIAAAIGAPLLRRQPAYAEVKSAFEAYEVGLDRAMGESVGVMSVWVREPDVDITKLKVVATAVVLPGQPLRWRIV